jgi:hypothetical protein
MTIPKGTRAIPLDQITTVAQASAYAAAGYHAAMARNWSRAAQLYADAWETAQVTVESPAGAATVKAKLVVANVAADAAAKQGVASSGGSTAPLPPMDRMLPQMSSGGFLGLNMSPVTMAIGSALVAIGIAWWKSGRPDKRRR